MKEKLKELVKDMWNVTNVLTMFRLVLVPIFAVVYLKGYPHWALAIFCLASLTDCLDGFIARKYHLITSFGKLMDPLADKLMVVTALVCLAIRHIFPWSIVTLVFLKELILVAGGALMLKHGIVVYANIVGKTATCSFIISLILGFLQDDFIALGIRPMAQPMLMISVGMAVCALISYCLDGWKKLHSTESTPTDEQR